MVGLVCGSRLAVCAALVAGVALVWADGANAAGKPTSGGGASAQPSNHPSAAPAPPPPPQVAVCAKPVIPGCMDDGGTFAAPERMTSCQGEVKDYVDRTMTYLKCLNDENVASGRDLTRNVDRFNCKLSGRKSCP
ncbi:hypothetical protein [Azospirillum griseum]|uniref:Cysteine rich repeat-containing protein n=1 Tax=Azospirillum griseum TaxID=2496639 RepID=A0A431VNA5_9PROT|nr:hypothetical protein [Azospirillum griseum]RTR24244.1 hypothetical protein EJ903_00190 [Azospirillum griseum]